MKLSQLKPAEGSTKSTKRRGRGPGSGQGKTGGRGHKGQKSIAGYSRKKDFEGGQMPLVRRLPKRGFTNVFRKGYQEVNLDRLDKVGKEEIFPADMAEARLISDASGPVKVLGRGIVSSAKTVHAHKFSQSARKQIEEKGGKIVIIGSR